MRFLKFVAMLIVTLRAVDVANAKDEILLTRELKPSRYSLVVVRSEPMEMTPLRVLRAHALRELPERCYVIKMELRSLDAPPILIASHLRVEDGTAADEGVILMASLVEIPDIVVVVAQGSDIAVWHVRVGWQASWSMIPTRNWSKHAAPYHVSPEKVSAELMLLGDDAVRLELLERSSNHASRHVLQLTSPWRLVQSAKE